MFWLTKYFKSIPSVVLFLFFYKINDKSSRPKEIYLTEHANKNNANQTIASIEGGEFCVIYNAFVPSNTPNGELITFVSQASLDHFDSVLELSNRWSTGPISIALYIPTDFRSQIWTLLAILYAKRLKFTENTNIHLFWANKEKKCRLPTTAKVLLPRLSCSLDSDECVIDRIKTTANKSTPNGSWYPVNIARNIARTGVHTKYELVADVELMPSPDLSRRISEFLHNRRTPMSREVYVIPVFEIDDTNDDLPADRSQLRKLMVKAKAVPFHVFKAPECHQIPEMEQWLQLPDHNEEPVRILASLKWIRPCWEPVYVALKGLTPNYDGRFRGYGKNKIQQLYEMCRGNFTFHVLTDVFLMHRKINRFNTEAYEKVKMAIWVNSVRFEQFKRELDEFYPDRGLIDYCNDQPSWHTETNGTVTMV